MLLGFTDTNDFNELISMDNFYRILIDALFGVF